MGFSRCLALLVGLSLIAICSCEKHHVGEFPEVQKENVDLTKKGDEHGTTAGESKTGSAHRPSPTPAEFFPEKKNP